MTTVGRVNVSCAESWLAQYDPRERWNGFLAAPAFDALTAVAILDEIERWNVAASSPEYGYDYDFDGDVLVVESRLYRAEDPENYVPERVAPDEDDLYTLGAYGWVWTEVEGI